MGWVGGWLRRRLLVGWHLQCRVASCRVEQQTTTSLIFTGFPIAHALIISLAALFFFSLNKTKSVELANDSFATCFFFLFLYINQQSPYIESRVRLLSLERPFLFCLIGLSRWFDLAKEDGEMHCQDRPLRVERAAKREPINRVSVGNGREGFSLIVCSCCSSRPGFYRTNMI